MGRLTEILSAAQQRAQSSGLPYEGALMPEEAAEVLALAPFTPGVNVTQVVVSNAGQSAIVNGKVYMELVDPDGLVVLRVPIVQTVTAGVSILPVVWNTSSFNPAYDPTKDYTPRP